MRLAYEPRPDPQTGWLAGSKTHLRQRLKSLTTLIDTQPDGSGGTVASSYTLTYEASPDSGRSLLRQVQRCAASTQVAATCLPATVFDYGRVDPAALGRLVKLGDWSGPAAPRSPQYSQYLRRYPLELSRLRLGDYNGDGRQDIAAPEGVYTATVTASTSGLQFTPAAQSTSVQEHSYSADLDGDGMSDLLTALGGTAWRICLARPSGASAAFQCWAWSGPAFTTTQGFKGSVFPNDVDGDGRDEVHIKGHRSDTAVQRCRYAGAGAALTCTSVSFYLSQSRAVALDEGKPGQVDLYRIMGGHSGDYDGDGISEIGLYSARRPARVEPDDPDLSTDHISIGRAGDGLGSGFSYRVASGSQEVVVHSPADGTGLSADLNQDGYADTAFSAINLPASAASVPDMLHLCQSTGVQLLCQKLAATGAQAHLAQLRGIADLDGDGAAELLFGPFANPAQDYGLNTSQPRRYTWAACRFDAWFGAGQPICRNWELPADAVQALPADGDYVQVLGDFLGQGPGADRHPHAGQPLADLRHRRHRASPRPADACHQRPGPGGRGGLRAGRRRQLQRTGTRPRRPAHHPRLAAAHPGPRRPPGQDPAPGQRPGRLAATAATATPARPPN